jgi:hypothetical protein
MKYCFLPLLCLLFLGNTQMIAKEMEAVSYSKNLKPIDLDSSLLHIMHARDEVKAVLLKFPIDGSPMNETQLLLTKLSVTLAETLVVLCEDDLREAKTAPSPEFLALWHHTIADYKVSMAEFYARTGDETKKKKYLSESTPHLIDVNAYLLDFEEINCKHLGKWVLVKSEQQKEVIARHKVIGKKKK